MYKLTYVTRVGRFYYTPNIGDSFGSSLHRALQEFHNSGGHESQSSEQLTEMLRQTWVPAGYSSLDEEKEHQELGMRLLEDYHANGGSGSVMLFTEKQLREDMGSFVLTGRIDRLDERPDGVYEIIDYKSGRDCVTEEEVANDLAMSVYQLLAGRKYPGRRVIATIHCLRTGKSASAELSNDELVELEEQIRTVAAEMLEITEDTEIDPEWKPMCERCDYLKICERRARNLEIHWGNV